MSRERAISAGSVAREAGVSAMTVSRVLHHSPRVSAATRVRVERAIAALGYAPDPQMHRLMMMVRGRKARRWRATLGVIRDGGAAGGWDDPAYQYVSTQSIRDRAEKQGFAVEEFFLGREGLTPARLERILRARGIEGLIVSPQSSGVLAAQFDYSRYAVATFGYGLGEPALHRVSTNMTQGILLAAAQLEARGYGRIGLAISRWVDDRADHTYSGALLHYQQTLPMRRRVPLLLFEENRLEANAGHFAGWLKRHRPDAVISFHEHVPDWLQAGAGLGIPDDIGLVVHDWTEGMAGFAGIDHRRREVAAAAVDMVATQLAHNETGVPAVPRQILIPPAWVEGASLRVR